MITLILFGFWLLLSQKFDAVHLGMGVVCSVVIGYFAHRLFRLPTRFTHLPLYPLGRFPWLRFITYLPWLLWQIVLANFQIAYAILHPKLQIQPKVIKFKTKLPHILAQATLANSITLTPGTVTLDVNQDEFVVHALTENAAQSLSDPEEHPEQMQNRVKRIFGRNHA